MSWLVKNCMWCHRSSDTARWCTMHHEWRNAATSPAIRQRSAHYLLCRKVSTWELDQSRQVRRTGAASAGTAWGLDSWQCRRLRHAQIWSVIVVSLGVGIISASSGGVWLGRWRDGNGWTAVPVCIALNYYSLKLFSSFSDSALVNCWRR